MLHKHGEHNPIIQSSKESAFPLVKHEATVHLFDQDRWHLRTPLPLESNKYEYIFFNLLSVQTNYNTPVKKYYLLRLILVLFTIQC